jgi:hypothetical protein
MGSIVTDEQNRSHNATDLITLSAWKFKYQIDYYFLARHSAFEYPVSYIVRLPFLDFRQQGAENKKATQTSGGFIIPLTFSEPGFCTSSRSLLLKAPRPFRLGCRTTGVTPARARDVGEIVSAQTGPSINDGVSINLMQHSKYFSPLPRVGACAFLPARHPANSTRLRLGSQVFFHHDGRTLLQAHRSGDGRGCNSAEGDDGAPGVTAEGRAYLR